MNNIKIMDDSNSTSKAKHYRYVITLDVPLWPRKLADELVCSGHLGDHLVSVTDLQTDQHIYGATYVVRGGDASPRRGARTAGDGAACRRRCRSGTGHSTRCC